MGGLTLVRDNYAKQIGSAGWLFHLLPYFPIPFVEVSVMVSILRQRRFRRVFRSKNALKHLESALAGEIAGAVKFMQDFEVHGNPLNKKNRGVASA